jgi:putative transcriptional regulator
MISYPQAAAPSPPARASGPSSPCYFQNRLRELRAARNWSQDALARRLEVSRQTVNAIETRKHAPNLRLAFRMAALFECPIEQIFAP